MNVKMYPTPVLWVSRDSVSGATVDVWTGKPQGYKLRNGDIVYLAKPDALVVLGHPYGTLDHDQVPHGALIQVDSR